MAQYQCLTVLSEPVKAKTQNYQYLKKHYQELLSDLQPLNSQAFCNRVLNSYSKLSQVFNDDVQLIQELRKDSNVDFREYATEIEDNSYSPLFAYNAYLDVCSQSDFDFTKLKLGVRNNIVNIDYLSQLHEQWILAYGPFTF